MGRRFYFKILKLCRGLLRKTGQVLIKVEDISVLRVILSITVPKWIWQRLAHFSRTSPYSPQENRLYPK